MLKVITISRRLGLSPQRAVRMLEALLLVALAIVLADLAWALVPPPERDQGALLLDGNERGRHTSLSVTERPHYGPSEALKSLFGEAEMTGFSGYISGPIRETNLKLTLKGILADRDSVKKLALIAPENGREDIYKINDTIEDAKITHIDSRRVILRRNGINESLSLELKDIKRLYAQDKQMPGDRRGPGGLARDNARNRLVSKQTLEAHLNNLPELLKQVKTVPYTEDGLQAGFRVVQVESGSVFNDLGFRQDDVIRSVNGIAIRNTKEALQAYRNLKSATAFQIDILRGDREVTINYSIQ